MADQVNDTMKEWAQERFEQQNPERTDEESPSPASADSTIPEWADEMEFFFDDLESAHPGLVEKVEAVSTAFSTGSVSAALGELLDFMSAGASEEGAVEEVSEPAGDEATEEEATEDAAPEEAAVEVAEAGGIGYPVLDEAEREEVDKQIAYHLGLAGEYAGGEKQAIAVGLREGAPEKYAQFEQASEA